MDKVLGLTCRGIFCLVDRIVGKYLLFRNQVPVKRVWGDEPGVHKWYHRNRW